MIFSLIVSAITFACASYLAVELANWLFSKVGRPAKASEDTMKMLRALLPVATGVVGAMLATYNADWKTFAILAIVCACLAMATWCELVFGVVPDAVLIAPLAIILIDAVLHSSWGQIAAAIMLAIPFGALALMSKGQGVARTDIELAALGGAILGFKFGVIAFVVALVAAFAINFQRRGEKLQVDLTPYLSSSIVVAILVRLVLPADIGG